MNAAGLVSTLVLIPRPLGLIGSLKTHSGNFSPQCYPLEYWWCSSSHDPPIPFVEGTQVFSGLLAAAACLSFQQLF